MSEVELIQWPDEADRLEVLRAKAQPRLLLVSGDALAPTVVDPLEDWLRLPASPDDMRARVAGLVDRAEAVCPPTPYLDGDGVLRLGKRWVALPPTEARLLQPLIDGVGRVISREVLITSGWPEGSTSRNSLDVHMLRIRRRIDEVGLTIKTVRNRGYLLEAG